MKRWMWNILCAFSLLLWVATVGLWLRSHWIDDLWVIPSPATYSAVRSVRGNLELICTNGTGTRSPPKRLGLGSFDMDAEGAYPMLIPTIHHQPPSAACRFGIIGVELDSYIMPLKSRHQPRPVLLKYSGAYRGYRLFIPHWLLALLYLVMPLGWFKGAIRQRRRPKLGLCQKCGYDLRASPERCPECGTAIPTGAKT
jgi:hypothetical protein